MAVFTLENVSFAYPGCAKAVLSDLSFKVEAGEFLLVCGASGSGKSTLLRLMKRLIAPAGTQSGQFLYKNTPIDTVPAKELAGEIGFVFQNVDSQLVSDHVYHELAFGLENLGVPACQIASKVAETASFFGISHYFDRRTDQLSGGEKQILNLASVMVSDPSVLILDEPLSQLDPISRLDFLSQLRRVNQELGITVILAEHHLDEVYPLCDRVMVLDAGTCLSLAGRKETAERLLACGHPMAQALPASIQVMQRAGRRDSFPVDVKQARAALSKAKVRFRETKEQPDALGQQPVISCKNVAFRYEKNKMVLSNFNLTVQKGGCVAVIGGNGAGKSTLLGILSGNLKPQGGKVKVRAAATAYLPQNPYHSFIKDTVEADLSFLIQRTGLPSNCMETMLERYAFFAGVERVMGQNPMDLSGGEAQKIALLKLLMTGSELILLDEPTKGLDAAAKEDLLSLLRRLNRQGITLVMVSHDLDFVARCAGECVMLFRGEAAAADAPAALFCANRFYTTSVRRITRGIVPHAVTAEDIEEAAE